MTIMKLTFWAAESACYFRDYAMAFLFLTRPGRTCVPWGFKQPAFHDGHSTKSANNGMPPHPTFLQRRTALTHLSQTVPAVAFVED